MIKCQEVMLICLADDEIYLIERVNQSVNQEEILVPFNITMIL